jgi:hypothetical protein
VAGSTGGERDDRARAAPALEFLIKLDRRMVVERYAVAMTFALFLAVLAAALLHQDAVSGDTSSTFFIAGLVSLVASLIVGFVTRRRAVRRLVALNRQTGLCDKDALVLANEELSRVAGGIGRRWFASGRVLRGVSKSSEPKGGAPVDREREPGLPDIARKSRRVRRFGIRARTGHGGRPGSRRLRREPR